MTSEPISDEYLSALSDMLGGDTDFDQHGFSMKRETLRAMLARIEALTAERDAAVAKLAERDDALKTGTAIMFSERSRQAVERAKAELTAEGERRATAAIVAWLQAVDGGCCVMGSFGSIASAIERGAHKPLDT